MWRVVDSLTQLIMMQSDNHVTRLLFKQLMQKQDEGVYCFRLVRSMAENTFGRLMHVVCSAQVSSTSVRSPQHLCTIEHGPILTRPSSLDPLRPIVCRTLRYIETCCSLHSSSWSQVARPQVRALRPRLRQTWPQASPEARYPIRLVSFSS